MIEQDTVLSIYYLIKETDMDVLKFNRYEIKYTNSWYKYFNLYTYEIDDCSDYVIYRKIYKLLYGV